MYANDHNFGKLSIDYPCYPSYFEHCFFHLNLITGTGQATVAD